MILRDGMHTFEFQQQLESQHDPQSLFFASSDDALKWLRQVGFLHTERIRQLRAYVARYWSDPETYRLTDQHVLRRLADLLYLRRIIVIGRDDRTAAGLPSAAAPAPPPPFPLSDRSQRSSTPPPPPPDSATFSADVDASAQAAALTAAAADGRPFCLE